MFKSPPSDLRIEIERLTGFYRGVVEDNVDPLKAGRVRVRIFGLHTEKTVKSETEGIPTEELPWSEPCLPIQEGSVTGFGMWAVPLQGSHVMLFFENGNPLQPRYFASMPGIPESKESYSNADRATTKHDGFKDPEGKYPAKSRLEEPDVHRLARGISEDTLVDTKNDNLDIGVPTALGGSWDEPESGFAARYPHNYVFTTHGGLTVELDSTPGARRVHIYHPSNSYIEIDNDGTMVVRNEGARYEVVMQNNNIHIRQDRNLTIDGNSKKKIDLNEQNEIVGDQQNEIGGDKLETIGGDMTQNIDGDKAEDIGGDKTEVIAGSKIKTVGSNETDVITGNKTETILGNLAITIIGNTSITSTGNIQLTAPAVGITGSLSMADQGALERLVKETFVALFNSHTHGGVDSGGDNTDPPDQPMGATHLTVNSQAS